jgi:hypothetical protein
MNVINLNMYHKIKILIVFLMFFSLMQLHPVFAQNSPRNDLLISWEASGFSPPNFKGKVLPSPGSIIKIGFEFVRDGKIIDLSKNKIYWYINNDLFSNSLGIKQISIITPNSPGSNIDIRIELPDFNVLKTIEIPIVKPKIVIDAPFPNKEVQSNNFEVYALPYFFNPKNNDLDYLDINWFINGVLAKPAKDDLFKLKTKIVGDSPTDITIGVYAQNTENQLEKAGDEINLKFTK